MVICIIWFGVDSEEQFPAGRSSFVFTKKFPVSS